MTQIFAGSCFLPKFMMPQVPGETAGKDASQESRAGSSQQNGKIDKQADTVLQKLASQAPTENQVPGKKNPVRPSYRGVRQRPWGETWQRESSIEDHSWSIRQYLCICAAMPERKLDSVVPDRKLEYAMPERKALAMPSP